MRACMTSSVVLIALGVWVWGAVEVRGHIDQVLFLALIGFVWLIISTHLFSWLGLSVGDDVVERRNSAALIALCGGMLGVALTYAGGNLGEGPSYWNNIFSAGLGTLGFFILWLLLETIGTASISIAEERDLASGIRLGGFLVGVGLILGRAVAGNWHSESATVHDFIHDGWTAAALCLLASVAEWFARPTRKRTSPGWLKFGLLPAAVYVGFATAWLCHLGRWEGMPTWL